MSNHTAPFWPCNSVVLDPPFCSVVGFRRVISAMARQNDSKSCCGFIFCPFRFCCICYFQRIQQKKYSCPKRPPSTRSPASRSATRGRNCSIVATRRTGTCSSPRVAGTVRRVGRTWSSTRRSPSARHEKTRKKRALPKWSVVDEHSSPTESKRKNNNAVCRR